MWISRFRKWKRKQRLRENRKLKKFIKSRQKRESPAHLPVFCMQHSGNKECLLQIQFFGKNVSAAKEK